MADVPEPLKLAKSQVEQGQKITITVRELLRWFGHKGRGWRVVSEIRRCLESLKLATTPDFAIAWIDGDIFITGMQEQNRDFSVAVTDYVSIGESVSVALSDPVIGGTVDDPTFRIGKLDAANRRPTSVKPDATLREAITVMLKEDYSQLPVMTSEREVKGVVTWRTIASRLALGNRCQFVRDCTDTNVEIVGADISLFRVIELIATQGFVLVRDDTKVICGILTETDVGKSFYQLGRPFLLLSEIENHIRQIIVGKFGLEELRAARNSNDPDREVTDVSDLTFGEYVRLLQNPEKWEKVGLGVDRATFTKTLENVNLIRNDVMHFDPDGIDEDDLDELRKTSKFLQEVRELSGTKNL